MSLPQPEVGLSGACSVISNNVLYSYSGKAFQSLALEEGAEWKELPGGVSVEGGVCVGNTDGLFIVGGTGPEDYTGLQKFTWSTGKWETIRTQELVAKNRRRHSAAYIPASNSILVYSGSQDGSDGLSSQTFTILASPPYSVSAYQSTVSPPGSAPLLLPWSDTQAAMIGGNPTNINVMLFSPETTWTDSGASLVAPLFKDGVTPKAALIAGDDGSRHLYTFDLSASPNRVDRILLTNGNGDPVAASAPITSGEEEAPGDVSRRQIASAWPEYNSTLAPSTSRSDFSVATAPDGRIVLSGGNDEEPLTIFNGKENQWMDTTKMLLGEQAVLSIESVGKSSTSSPSSTASSVLSSITATPTSSFVSTDSGASSTIMPAETASSTSDPIASPTPDKRMPATTILGIVLGIIFGIAIVLCLLLFCIKKARKKQDAARAGSAGGSSGMVDEKGPMPQDSPQGPNPFFRGHGQQDSQGSFSSMAILVGKGQKPGVQRNASHATKRSSLSSIFNKEFKSTIGRPQVKEAPEPDFFPSDTKAPNAGAGAPNSRARGLSVNQDDTMRRSSGWNRYWSGASLNVIGLGSSGNNTQRQTMVSESSRYSDTNRLTQDSATVPPLHVDGRFELHRVNSGSPTVSQYNPQIKNGMSGQIERPISSASSSGYSSGIPASVHEAWDPSTLKKPSPWGADRAPDSAYNNRDTANFFNDLAKPAPTQPPAGVSRQPQLATAVSSDMSWLNLGENSTR